MIVFKALEDMLRSVDERSLLSTFIVIFILILISVVILQVLIQGDWLSWIGALGGLFSAFFSLITLAYAVHTVARWQKDKLKTLMLDNVLQLHLKVKELPRKYISVKRRWKYLEHLDLNLGSKVEEVSEAKARFHDFHRKLYYDSEDALFKVLTEIYEYLDDLIGTAELAGNSHALDCLDQFNEQFRNLDELLADYLCKDDNVFEDKASEEGKAFEELNYLVQKIKNSIDD